MAMVPYEPNSPNPVIPATAEIARQLPSVVLYQLEEAGRLATEILDERVVQWTEDDWTQQQIADEMGCGRSTVADRQRRLGVTPTSPRGAPRKELSVSDNSEAGQDGTEPEAVDAEPVEEETAAQHDSPKSPLPAPAKSDLREAIYQLSGGVRFLASCLDDTEGVDRGDLMALSHELDQTMKALRTVKKRMEEALNGTV